MKILIIGGDGYLGWPTAMHFSNKGYEVTIVDNFSKRNIELEENVSPLWQINPLIQRIEDWKNQSGNTINFYAGDMMDANFVYKTLEKTNPDAIIHYGEQPSAPYSMKNLKNASFTQSNNVIGNLNLIFGIKSKCPNAHLIKLGTMGEYGQPNIDIEEGYLEIEHNGRKANVLYPKKPGSFYHLSKVHDTNNIYFACNVWGLRSTDLNQGVVYGIDTNETILNDNLNTSFHYDDIFGTVLNRFCTMAALEIPLTIYGNGSQLRSYLNIKDTIQCVDIAVNSPPNEGVFKIYNQFTEVFSINELADKVEKVSKDIGLNVKKEQISNPRTEIEDHYYNPKNDKLLSLGLKPNFLSDDFLKNTITKILQSKHLIKPEYIPPKIKWKEK